MEKTIEIPFGAKDSELKGWEYTIPENMEAEIKDGKIIVKQKESEDEKIRKELLNYIKYDKEHTPETTPGEHWDRWIAYLERQKEQQPAEWSEEDNRNINTLISVIEAHYNEYELVRDDYPINARELGDWLKSLRPSWKPSEEQMDAIQYVSNLDYGGHRKALESLYSDLKKL